MTTPANIITLVSNIVRGVEEHEGLINTIAGMAGILPEVSLAEKALPAIVAVLTFLQEETGKAPLDVFRDFLNHITPGAANSSTLGPDIPQGG